MIDTYDLLQDFYAEYNTHQLGHVRPSNFIRWVNAISKELFEEKFANGWQVDQKNTDDIGKPFLKSAPLRISSAGGFDVLPYPADYGHISSARFYHKGDYVCVEPPGFEAQDPDADQNYYYQCPDSSLIEVEITIIQNNRWGATLSDKVLCPKKNKPAITQFNGGFRIEPKGIDKIVLDYLRKPKPAIFDYDTVLGSIVYNKAASKPLEWSELLKGEFLSRLGMKYGKFIQQPLLYQMSDKEKK